MATALIFVSTFEVRQEKKIRRERGRMKELTPCWETCKRRTPTLPECGCISFIACSCGRTSTSGRTLVADTAQVASFSFCSSCLLQSVARRTGAELTFLLVALAGVAMVTAILRERKKNYPSPPCCPILLFLVRRKRQTKMKAEAAEGTEPVKVTLDRIRTDKALQEDI